MNKKEKGNIKKVNISKQEPKKNLSLLRKHIYNYKLEIVLSILLMALIFLIALLYPNSYLAEDNDNISENISNSDNINNSKQSIEDYISNIEKDDTADTEDYIDSSEGESEDNSSLDNNEENDERGNLEEVDKKEVIDPSDAFINSFGDGFSSDTYLNLEETNMYLDDTSTALMFKPLYKFSKLSSCGGADNACDFQKDLRILDYGMQVCIESTNNCLKVINKNLYYNGREVALPDEIINKEVISLTVGALDTKFLLGAVLPQGEDEYGLVYFFDGTSFENIISKDSENSITSKYQRQGGRIGFGGSDDNFLILYAGYRGQAYQVYNGELIDISDMFGLRVVNRGFMPQIIQSGTGTDSTWYICGLDKKKPKFIKLWQNGSKYIQGSLDLTYKIYTTSALYDNFNYCYLSENDNRKLYLTFGDNNNLDIWQFQDNGFDNSHDYSVVSSDILNKEDYVAKKAIIKEMSLSVFEKGYTSDVNEYGTLYLSTNSIDWQKVDVGKFLSFKELSPDLYWRLDLKSRDNYFSPWLFNMNRLNYLLLKQD